MSADQSRSNKDLAASDNDLWNQLTSIFAKVISDLDERKTAAHVQALRSTYPDESTEQIIERLIRNACLRAAGVGAASAGAAIVPGIGTVTALTVGIAADIGATFKIQAELVLEIASARNYTLNEQEKKSAVMIITGMSSGANQVLKKVTTQVTEQYAQKWVTHALPVVGIGASAALNALTTYVVGQRANAYFALGPDAMVGFWDTLAALSGVDVKFVGSWVATGAANSWAAAVSSANAASSLIASGASATGSAIVSGASTASDVVTSGASTIANGFVAGVNGATSYVTASVTAVSSAGRWSAETLAAYARSGVGTVGDAGSWVAGSVVDGVGAVKRRIWHDGDTKAGQQTDEIAEDRPEQSDPSINEV